MQKVYSNGRSEEILGAAIKKLGLPREELVILTKVRFLTHGLRRRGAYSILGLLPRWTEGREC